MAKVFRDTVSGWTHVGGAIAAIVGTVFLAITGNTGAIIAAYIIFGVSMFLLFSAKLTLLNPNKKNNFQSIPVYFHSYCSTSILLHQSPH